MNYDSNEELPEVPSAEQERKAKQEGPTHWLLDRFMKWVRAQLNLLQNFKGIITSLVERDEQPPGVPGNYILLCPGNGTLRVLYWEESSGEYLLPIDNTGSGGTSTPESLNYQQSAQNPGVAVLGNNTETLIASVKITPRFANSVIMVHAKSDVVKDSGTGTVTFDMRIKRNGEFIGTNSASQHLSGGLSFASLGSMMLMDVSGLTSEVTYELYAKASGPSCAAARYAISACEMGVDANASF